MRDFEQRWENNRKRLYGLLIYLVKDIDLADDLLQETYLRAQQKIGTYRDGDFGAWLAAIAKSVAFTHLRRAYVNIESPFGEDTDDAIQEDAGADSHVEAMLVRNAVGRLSPTLRGALILKHYGGFNYTEIAARLNCPVGTAKRRVWTAVRKLRAALGTPMEEIDMKCNELALLDYAYGTLPDADGKSIEAHLAACDICKTQLGDIRKVIESLQNTRDQIVFVNITEILADGSSVTYSTFRETNNSDTPSSSYSVGTMKYHCWQSVFVDGVESSFDVTDAGDGEFNNIGVHLKHPMAPGQSVLHLGIFTTPERTSGASFDIGFGRRVAVPENSGTVHSDHLLVQMVRLPEEARLIGSVPIAEEVREGAKTTLVWRRLMRAGEVHERLVVVYSQ